jgi:hypothetical protein
MDSCVVPHRSTNRAVLWLTAQIGRDAVLSESYGRRQQTRLSTRYIAYKKNFFPLGRPPTAATLEQTPARPPTAARAHPRSVSWA